MIYEDELHIAVLDMFPSVRGQALVLPKQHYGSYVFEMQEQEYVCLMNAARSTARLIDEKLGAIRTCMVMEGMEIDHAHIKLYPIYCVRARVSEETADLSEYLGFITTLHGKRAWSEALAAVQGQFR